jgi:hypothetical protein
MYLSISSMPVRWMASLFFFPFFEIDRIWTLAIGKQWGVAYFSEPRWTTHRPIWQTTRHNAYLSNDTQKQALLCFMRPWTLREALKKRLIGVVSKMASYPRTSDFLGISR